jgi:hypothetical protein
MRSRAAWAVLAVTLLTWGCEGEKKPEPPKSGEFVPEDKKPAAPPEATPPPTQPAAKFEGAAEHLARHGQEGLALEQGPEYYTKDNLFEIIDGASEGYIAYGMTQMAKAVYKPQSGDYKDEINVEVYRYEPPLGAMGKFAQERSSCADGHPAHWCVRQSDLIFWKGAQMVKIQAFDDSPAGAAAILKVAQALEPRLPGDANLPEFLKKMPEANRVAGGAGWSPRDEFGFSGLGPVWLQDYKPDGDAYKAPEAKVVLFAAQKQTPEEAQKLFADIKAKVEGLEAVQKAGGVKALAEVGEEAFWFDDGYGKHTVTRKGAVVAGGRDFQEEATATSLTKLLAAGL